jgi:hypothetical protein
MEKREWYFICETKNAINKIPKCTIKNFRNFRQTRISGISGRTEPCKEPSTQLHCFQTPHRKSESAIWKLLLRAYMTIQPNPIPTLPTASSSLAASSPIPRIQRTAVTRYPSRRGLQGLDSQFQRTSRLNPGPGKFQGRENL